MIDRPNPAWFAKAREFANRVPSPVGKPFATRVQAKAPQRVELYLYDAIGLDPWTGEGTDPSDVVAALKEAKGAAELDVHINSPGGSVFDGLAIFNAIRSFAGKKTVYVDGVAASIASIIALAGDKVVTNEGAMWMAHDPASGVLAFGTAEQIEDEARKTVSALRKVRENLIDIYARKTGKSVSQISAWMSAETWMTAAEALERGFTDEIAAPSANDMGCDCEEPCGANGGCPCGGKCSDACECDCGPLEDGEGAEDGPPKKMPHKMCARDQAEMARIQVRALNAKFSGASPGVPGQPGATKQPARKVTP